MSSFTSDGTENRMRWDRRTPGFMEVWYATINEPRSHLGIWLRYTLTAPRKGDPYCELWGFVFDPHGSKDFAAKVRHPIDRLAPPDGRDDGAIVRIADSWLSENHLEGEVVADDGRTLAWSLDFDPADRCFQHIPAVLRDRIEKRVSTLCSPNLSVPITGTVKLGGHAIELTDAPGMQSHRWGSKHSHTWTWAHCSRFEEHDAVFEGVAAKTKIGFLPAPTTTLLYLRYADTDILFNDLRTALRTKSRYELPTWAFHARNDAWRLVGAARARTDRMFQVTYHDPDGSERYCANSEIGELALELYKSTDSGWRHEASLRSSGFAHLEFGQPQPFAELPITL